ncbi:MAG: hypothetical protein VKK62_11720 [Synechococcaceae cyanobacterium]|nr:hypothetical protein [Synechococcaceae cyanobacterium]
MNDTLTTRDVALDLGHQIDLLNQLEASLALLQGQLPNSSRAASELLLARVSLQTAQAHIRTASTDLAGQLDIAEPT